ncbi:MAG: threonine--tRNA ligase [Thermoplasmata archaeon]|nr:threonine--tRNA ligase [Thermoplasmata archaeon]
MPADSAPVLVTFPDGTTDVVPPGTCCGDALARWRPSEAPGFLAAFLDGTPVDLSRPIGSAGRLSPITFRDRAGQAILHHSCAHLVAKAIVELVPDARPTVGPATTEGFHYDFDMRPLTPDDLPKLAESMSATVRSGERFERLEVAKEDALRMVSSNPYKAGYIAEVGAGEPVSFYRTGTFVDLCRGPHVPHAGWLKGIHILGFSAVTLGGVPEGTPLQRVRGVGFPTREELDTYLKMRKEAEARDHRVLGQKLELFTFVDSAPGFPIWLPRGMIVERELESFVREHLHASHYSEVRTPLMFAQSVFETSGHWEHYRADMFLTEIEGRSFGWKPMNCPGAMLVFGSRARSYRELPLRLAEFAPLHRLEASGTIHGMTRVREFVQDDAHLFVTEEQIEEEVTNLLAWVREAFTTFRLGWSYELSTRPTQFLGEVETWDRAEAILERTLKGSGVEYRVSPGEGAFYGPKIDIHLRDSMGRPWQTGTIQLDYQMPRRFRLEYQGPDGQLHTPTVIHRTILGSVERFLGVLLEHVNGRLPPWLSPEQVRVLPVGERHENAANDLVAELETHGIRAESSGSQETLGKRVRAAEVERVPYIAVLGDTEVAGGSVALRVRGQKAQEILSSTDFVARVREKVRTRSFDP